MLVLTRKSGETVHISTDITVTVLAINGNRIRMGIEAPPQIHVVRGELTCPVPGGPDNIKEGYEAQYARGNQ